MKIKISIHPDKHTQKPKYYGGLAYGYETEELTLQELSVKIEQGHTVVPSLLKGGHRKNVNFISSQVIFLDFDENENPTDKISEIEEYGIKVNLFYNSYSHTADFNKFRLGIVLDTQIEDAVLFKNMITSLIQVGNSDGACKDLSRMFYAGTNSKVLCEDLNSFEVVKGAFTDLINKNKVQNHYNRTYKKVLSVSKSSSSKERGGNTALSINTIEEAEYTPKVTIRKFNYKEACNNSKVFNGFDKGFIHLKYMQLRALVTNMQYAKGGLKWVQDKMNLRGDYNGSDYSLLSSIPKYNYKPEVMASFDTNATSYHNIIELDDTVRENITQIREINKQDVAIISKTMRKHHANALTSANRVSVINAPTGTGKTELMISMPNVIIGSPTHRLKNEMAERMETKGLPYVFTPDNPIFVSTQLQERFDNLQAMEESSLAFNLMKDVANADEVEGVDYLAEDTSIAIEYKAKLVEAYESEVTVLTTHKRLMLTPHLFQNKEVVYFDEDITHLLLHLKSVNNKYVHNKLHSLIRGAAKGSDFEKDCRMVLKEVSEITQNRVGVLRTSTKYLDRNGFFTRLASIEGCSLLAGFIKSSDSLLLADGEDISQYYYGEIKRISKVFSNVVIFSATAQRFFYDRLFKLSKEPYDFFHCGYAKNITPIKHNVQKSYSKSALKRSEFPQIDSNILITYKDYAKTFPNQTEQDVYFGNTEGVDKYKGLDISIVGALLEPVNSTIMKATLLGLPIESTIKNNVRVTLDHFSFNFFTFEDKNLANIELRTAQSHIKQGNRARTTRTSAKVDIHTSLPIEDSDIFTGKNFIKSIDNSLEPISTEYIAGIDVHNWELIKALEESLPPKEQDEQLNINFAS